MKAFSGNYLLKLFVLFSFCVITSCSSDEDLPSIQEYILENGITTQTTASGLNYIIRQAGNDSKPTVSSTITINYRGYLLDGSEFDSGNNVTFPLSRLIAGWQEGIPLIGSGGDITLLIPANLAYGSSGQGSIPPNTDIGFDIQLISFE